MNETLRQLRAVEVAKFTLKQKLERIEWEERELKPYLERIALEAGSTLEIPELIIHDDQAND